MKARMNIRSIIIIVTIIYLASMFFINFSFATNTGKIISDTVKLREKPNTDSKVLELVSMGEKIEIVNEENGWYQVKYNKITGYIRSDLIEKENTAENVENTVTENETNNTENNTSNNAENTENVTNKETTTEVVNQEKEDIKEELGKRVLFDNAKLKIIPLISAIELGEVSKDTEVEVIEILNGWAKIKTTDGKQGWIRNQIKKENGEIFVVLGLVTDNNNSNNNQSSTSNSSQTSTTQTKTMYVNSQTINLRTQASTSSKVVKQLTLNKQVTVLSTENGWSHVQVDGVEGYIYSNLLTLTKKEVSRSGMNTRSNDTKTETTTAQLVTAQEEVKQENTSVTETTKVEDNTEKAQTTEKSAETTTTTMTTTSTVTGSDIVAYAKQYLGYKYVYGGTTTNGFDCSGFVQYVYKHFGISLNRTAAAQYSNGVAVSSTDLQLGDLIMFGPSGISHVGIYIGGNNIIHAANSSRGVTIDTIASGYYKTNYVGARRVL